MKLTVFACDRVNGHDLGMAIDVTELPDRAHETHIKEAVGAACMTVINALRKYHGKDARTYDINVRFE